MVRSGALTLGAFLSLGAFSSAEAQDASAFSAVSPTSLAGVLPYLPQNWSDLPVQFRASEAVGYNSNVSNTPFNNGFSLLGSKPIGTFESISNYGASTKWDWGGQQFFADGSYGFSRYLNNADLNTPQNSADVGVNWVYSSRCAGKLIASEATALSEPGQQVGVNVINSVTTTNFNETSKCIVTGDYSAIFNVGTTTSTNSAAEDKFNDFQSAFVAAGMTYNVTQTDSLELLGTLTGTSYNQRGQLVNNVGLANKITEEDVNLTYTRNLNPNLSFIISVGIVGIRDGYFDFGWPSSGFEPQYALSVVWSITPKIDLLASIARAVAPPTSIISNLQQSKSVNLNLTYRFTPKVSLAAGVSASQSTGAFGQSVAGAVAAAQSTTDYSLRMSASYAMTPFLQAVLSYQYTKELQSGIVVTPTSIALLTVNYAPH